MICFQNQSYFKIRKDKHWSAKHWFEHISTSKYALLSDLQTTFFISGRQSGLVVFIDKNESFSRFEHQSWLWKVSCDVLKFLSWKYFLGISSVIYLEHSRWIFFQHFCDDNEFKDLINYRLPDPLFFIVTALLNPFHITGLFLYPLKISENQRNHLQISLLISTSKFKRINYFIFPPKSSQNLWFSDNFRENWSWLK